MKRILFLLPILLAWSCAAGRVETAKNHYEAARLAQQSGSELQAVLHWKAVVQKTSAAIARSEYPSTNYFLRASAYVELGQWDLAFEDLKQIDVESLSKDEYWIYPLYAVLMGDYYAEHQLTSVADSFYQAVLNKSSLKPSPIYFLALQRSVNNSIKRINQQSAQRSDREKFKQKEFETLLKEIKKYTEDHPFHSVAHFLLADLHFKTGAKEEAVQHLLASLELGLPTLDLKRTAEFELASLLSNFELPPPLKSLLLERAKDWWGKEGDVSILKAGEGEYQSVFQQAAVEGASEQTDSKKKVRYLAVDQDGTLKILVWEEL